MADDVMLMEKGKIRERLLPEALAYRQERFYENDFKYAGKEARV